MLLAVPTLCPNYAQIMQLVLKFIPFCKMSDRVAILSRCHKLLFYCILLCLGYGVWLCLLVLVWSLPASYRAAWLTPFGKLANERYCDQHHLATSGPVISCQTASLRGRLSLSHTKTRMRLKHWTKMVSGVSKYTDYASSATSSKSAKIMLAQSIKAYSVRTK